MIISASRRTDIPAHYSSWLLHRFQEGFVLIPHPYQANQLGRLALTPDTVDCLVFWTKNPQPMLSHLEALDALGYTYYFTFTLTAYGLEVEQNLPPKSRLIKTFQQLSQCLGPERVDWRYDPIFMDHNHTISWHWKHFESLCQALHGYTQRCIISFLTLYPHLKSTYQAPCPEEIQRLAQGLAQIAASYGLPVFSCASELDFKSLGIQHAACIDQQKIETLLGWPLQVKKEPHQRKACGCVQSIDIGAYHTCPHGCTYCYANTNKNLLQHYTKTHHPKAPMLTGYPRGTEIITNRTALSVKVRQLSLFP